MENIEKSLYSENINKALDSYFDFRLEILYPGKRIKYDTSILKKYLGIEKEYNDMNELFWMITKDYIHPDDLENVDLFREIDIKKRKQAQNKFAVNTEFRIKTVTSDYKWVSAIVASDIAEDGEMKYIMILVKNINEKKLIELECTQLARKDAMTRLNNKVYMQNLIEEDLKFSRDSSALVLIDVDNFKTINDTYGHITGDNVILKIASRLLENTRDTDYVGRVGGDEFLVYFKGSFDRNKLENKLILFLNNMHFIHEEEDCYVDVHCSIGAVICGNDDRKYLSVYKKADDALYKAKEAGKNTFYIY